MHNNYLKDNFHAKVVKKKQQTKTGKYKINILFSDQSRNVPI